MTFNIKGSFSIKDGLNAWQQRSQLNVQTIKHARPDIIGFQEFQGGNLKTYKECLPEYQYILGPHIDDIEPYTYNAIAWNPARFTLIDAGGFWLSTTPERMSSDWESACTRVAHWTKLHCIQTNADMIHVNTHLDHISEQARQEGGKLILRKLTELGFAALPTVLTGDFNSSRWLPDYDVHIAPVATDATYRIFQDNGFVDTYVAAGQQDSSVSNTFHAFEGSQYTPAHFYMTWRIDWILFRDSTHHLKTNSCTIIHDAQPPLYPSDHYPVLAELTLKI
jgi:endonuclease/exonuclease/phosphatase family metal-dependent hydrolase